MICDLHGGHPRHGGIASFASAPFLLVIAVVAFIAIGVCCKETRLAAFLEHGVFDEMVDPSGQEIGAKEYDALLIRQGKIVAEK